MQQDQAAGLSSHGRNSENLESFWQGFQSTQSSQAARSRSDKATSQLILHTTAQKNSRSAGEALPGQSSNERHEEGQDSHSGSTVGSGSTAPSLSPAQGFAPSIASPLDLERSPPAETSQLEKVATMQGAVSLAGAWKVALSQAMAPSVFASLPEEPTADMLQYAAAPAQLPPSGITCEAWLAQADQHRCVSASPCFHQTLSD